MLVVLTLAIIAYNNVVNQWSWLHTSWGLAANLLAASLLVAIAIRGFGADWKSLGLRGPHGRGVLLGVAVALVLVVPLFAALLHPSTAQLIADARVARLDRSELMFRILVRIPLATALLEEIAFRGVLPALWRRGRIAVPSIAFGLWHIVPTMDAIELNTSDPGAAAIVLGVSGAVLLTTVVGALLIRFRDRAGSLGAPLAFHAVLNSLATVAAWLAVGRTT